MAEQHRNPNSSGRIPIPIAHFGYGEANNDGTIIDATRDKTSFDGKDAPLSNPILEGLSNINEEVSTLLATLSDLENLLSPLMGVEYHMDVEEGVRVTSLEEVKSVDKRSEAKREKERIISRISSGNQRLINLVKYLSL